LPTGVVWSARIGLVDVAGAIHKTGDLLDGVHGAVLLLARAWSCLGWSPRPPAVVMPGITEYAGQLGVERLLHATRVGRLPLPLLGGGPA
jgi:hypothetical protein